MLACHVLSQVRYGSTLHVRFLLHRLCAILRGFTGSSSRVVARKWAEDLYLLHHFLHFLLLYLLLHLLLLLLFLALLSSVRGLGGCDFQELFVLIRGCSCV